MKNAKINIAQDLNELGVAGCYHGERFTYLALEIIEREPGSLSLISKQIYPAVGKQCGTSSACVERNLRTFVNVLWRPDNHCFLEKIAGRPLKRRPSNREFLDIMYNYYVKNR